ncbi:hypothetical protein OROHE_005692 [Orobanche hederae]
MTSASRKFHYFGHFCGPIISRRVGLFLPFSFAAVMVFMALGRPRFDTPGSRSHLMGYVGATGVILDLVREGGPGHLFDAGYGRNHDWSWRIDAGSLRPRQLSGSICNISHGGGLLSPPARVNSHPELNLQRIVRYSVLLVLHSSLHRFMDTELRKNRFEVSKPTFLVQGPGFSGFNSVLTAFPSSDRRQHRHFWLGSPESHGGSPYADRSTVAYGLAFPGIFWLNRRQP